MTREEEIKKILKNHERVLKNHEKRISNLEKIPKEKPREKVKKYKEKSSAWYLSKLISGTDFFKERRIRTTPELVKTIWVKFRKKVALGNAPRDFSPVVKSGELDRDFIPPSRESPKGIYIWFPLGTSKQEVERYKSTWGGDK